MICRDVLNDRSRDARLIAVIYDRRHVLCTHQSSVCVDGYLEKPALKFYNSWKYKY